MLNVHLLIPPTIDNQFRGHKLALWFFYLFAKLLGIQSAVEESHVLHAASNRGKIVCAEVSEMSFLCCVYALGSQLVRHQVMDGWLKMCVLLAVAINPSTQLLLESDLRPR